VEAPDLTRSLASSQSRSTSGWSLPGIDMDKPEAQPGQKSRVLPYGDPVLLTIPL